MRGNADARGSEAAPSARLRLFLDGTPLVAETGGIRRYVEELALALAQAGTGDEVHLVSDQALPASPRLEAGGVRLHRASTRGWNRRWWLVGLPRACRRMGASVFHGTDFAVPYLHITPAVLTIHDLSPWKQTFWQPEATRIRQRTPWMLRFGLADEVITVSQTVRQEVLEHFSISPERVHAIPLAADARFRPVALDRTSVPYFLFVGTIEPRKNLPALIQAWRPVFEELQIPLKVAGRRREDFARHAELPADLPGLEWLGAVEDETLPGLYSGALAVVYPSEYEGFGLPVLEAMQCGVPVVTGTAAALREVAGEAAVQVSAKDTGALRTILRRFATDAAWRREWSVRSLQRAAAFSWTATAAATRAVYLEAIHRFARKA